MQVHHLMVVGCPSPATSSRNLWNCGGSLGEEGLDYPGSTCPGSPTSQVHNMEKAKLRQY